MTAIWNRRTVWVIAVFAVLGAAFLSRITTARYVQNEAAVRHTMAVQAAIAGTLSLLKDAETGQRGYLLTGDSAFLEPHALAESTLGTQLAQLRELTRDDAEQTLSYEAVQRLSQSKLERVATTIQLKREGREAEALALVRTGYGKRLMDGLRAESERMLARERVRLAQRELDAKHAQRRTWFALGATLLVALAVAFVGLSASRRDATEATVARQRLLESERAFRSLADNASDLVRILEADNTLSYASPSSLALLGFTPEEMLEMGAVAWLHEDDRPRAAEISKRVRETGGQSEPWVHRIKCKSGEYRWFETRVSPALGSASESGAVHLSSRDVTERRVAEEALREQSERLESILTSMGDGVLVLDRDRRVLVVNPAAQEHVRQAEGEIISAAKWTEEYSAFLPDGVTPFPMADGPLTRALRGEACDHVEMVVLDRAGHTRVHSITARPLYDQNTLVGCVGVYHDITLQRRAERDLAESERRWRALSEASFEGVAISKQGRIVDCNHTFASWLGRTPEELVGADGMAAFALEEREHVANSSQQSGTMYETRMVRADGTLFPVEIRGRAATFNGEAVRIAVVRDVTEKKQREAELKEQAERLRSLSLRDELTGLYNRRGFLELGRQQLRNIARSQRRGCLFYADLNGMKAINDELGHELGDRAIAATASILSSVFRESDVIARLGGDEFAVLAAECDHEGQVRVKHRLQAAVEAFNAEGREPFLLSISIGGALYDPRDAATLETLMMQADAKMYEEKKARARRQSEADAPASVLRLLSS